MIGTKSMKTVFENLLEDFDSELRKLLHENDQNSRPPQNSLYHYTRSDNLLNILKRQEVWLTSYRALQHGDREELSATVINQLIQVWAKRPTFELFWHRFYYNYHKLHFDTTAGGNEDTDKYSVYVVSFCEARNNAYLWDQYGDKGTGCAIGFHKQDFTSSNGNEIICVTSKIEYNKAKFTELLNQIPEITEKYFNKAKEAGLLRYTQDMEGFERGLYDRIESHLLTLAPCFKREDFIKEQEHRLYAPVIKHEGKFYPKQVEIFEDDKKRRRIAIKFKLEDVSEIWIGPKADFEIEKKKLLECLSELTPDHSIEIKYANESQLDISGIPEEPNHKIINTAYSTGYLSS